VNNVEDVEFEVLLNAVPNEVEYEFDINSQLGKDTMEGLKMDQLDTPEKKKREETLKEVTQELELLRKRSQSLVSPMSSISASSILWNSENKKTTDPKSDSGFSPLA